MSNDGMKDMFARLKDELETQVRADGHKNRFTDRLQQRTAALEKKKSKFSWRPLSIAASVILLLGFSLFFIQAEPQESDLASVSPEMQQTQSFFTNAINHELETIQNLQTPETKRLVDDAITQLTILETEYQSLKMDLKKSGQDKRVIYAMITNFQSRIDLLKEVASQIDELKNLKYDSDENLL
ncbi:MAG: hypothetical protein ACI836_000925 [Saprospiraceae bacterium]|jgi:hypothetical protein|uniref:hypothetical protein n=1 Tax=Patiriisocius sp. Uisw_047 TaxID=3230969 RepID=UPI0039ED503E